MIRVLVTGANGFVGRHVCRRLLDDGNLVRGTYRRDTASLVAGVEPVRIGPVEDFDAWLPTLTGIDAVVHLIARTHVMNERESNPLDKYRAVNVAGTQRLLAACRNAGVQRFVFLSSIKAVGEGKATAYCESDACAPEDAYGISKREAEQLIESSTHGWLSHTILRPPLVYGYGVRGNFARIINAVRRGIPLPLGSVRNARSMIYVENLADAICTCLSHSAAAGETFHVADSLTISTRRLVELLSWALGKPARLAPSPIWLLRAGGLLAGKQAEVNRLVGSLTMSTRHIRDILDWQPPFDIEEGFRRTVATSDGPHGDPVILTSEKAA